MSKHTVIVVLESHPGQEKDLEQVLLEVLEYSRAEKTNIEYRLHKSLENPTQFILYESWISKEKHEEQFTKPYIIKLGTQLESLLAKPYQAFFADELSALKEVA